MTKCFGARWSRGTLIVALVGILSIGVLAVRPANAQDAAAAKTLDKTRRLARGGSPKTPPIYSTSLRLARAVRGGRQ